MESEDDGIFYENRVISKGRLPRLSVNPDVDG